MLGCSGPFGKLDVRDDSQITYKILTLHQDVRPRQPVKQDSFNCGLIWCLFVYDMMLQVTESYYNILPQGYRELPLSLGIGKTWLHPRVFNSLHGIKSSTINKKDKDHYKVMCNDLRVELVCLFERLQLLRLQSFSKQINIPDKWGVFNSVLSKQLLTPLRNIIFKIPTKKVVSDRLTEEKVS